MLWLGCYWLCGIPPCNSRTSYIILYSNILWLSSWSVSAIIKILTRSNTGMEIKTADPPFVALTVESTFHLPFNTERHRSQPVFIILSKHSVVLCFSFHGEYNGHYSPVQGIPYSMPPMEYSISVSHAIWCHNLFIFQWPFWIQSNIFRIEKHMK